MQSCVSDIFLLKVLTKSVFYRIIIKVLFILRGVAQLVARQFWELDVAGSSPVTPTIPSVLTELEGFCMTLGFLLPLISMRIAFIAHRPY